MARLQTDGSYILTEILILCVMAILAHHAKLHTAKSHTVIYHTVKWQTIKSHIVKSHIHYDYHNYNDALKWILGLKAIFYNGMNVRRDIMA